MLTEQELLEGIATHCMVKAHSFATTREKASDEAKAAASAWRRAAEIIRRHISEEAGA